MNEMKKFKGRYLTEETLDKIQTGWGDGGVGVGLLAASFITYMVRQDLELSLLFLGFGVINWLLAVWKLWKVKE